MLARLAESLEQSRRFAANDAEGLVCGGVALLLMVLENVIDNALKFSEGAVRVRVEEGDALVTLRVCDEGPGIPYDER